MSGGSDPGSGPDSEASSGGDAQSDPAGDADPASADDPLTRVRESDVSLIVGGFLALYLGYVLVGIVAGLSPRGIFATVTQLTLLIAIYAMLTLSLNLHWGYTGLFNIGIVGFMAVGGYTFLMLTMQVAEPGVRSAGGLGLPFVVGLAGAVVAAAVLGFVVGLPSLRLRADYLAITTIAMAEIVRYFYQSNAFQQVELFGMSLGTGGGSGLVGDSTTPFDRYVYDAGWSEGLVDFLDETFRISGTLGPPIETLFDAIVLLVVVAGFYWLLKRTGGSPFGRVLKAIREDEDVANALGKDTGRFKMKSFMLGCALMGLAGALYVYFQLGNTVNPTVFRPRLTFFVWVALILGGAGSNTGSVLGAALFVGILFRGPLYVKNAVENIVAFPDSPATVAGALGGLLSLDPVPFLAFLFDNMGSLRIILLGVVLIVLMKRRPQGLLGHRKETAAAVPLVPTETTATGGLTPGSEGPEATDGGEPGGGGERP